MDTNILEDWGTPTVTPLSKKLKNDDIVEVVTTVVNNQVKNESTSHTTGGIEVTANPSDINVVKVGADGKIIGDVKEGEVVATVVEDTPAHPVRRIPTDDEKNMSASDRLKARRERRRQKRNAGFTSVDAKGATKKEEKGDTLPSELSNMEESSITTTDGKRMFPLNLGGGGNKPKPQTQSESVKSEPSKKYGDMLCYIYFSGTTSSYNMKAEMLEFALADNRGRVLYAQINDIKLSSVDPVVFNTVVPRLPKDLPNKVNYDRDDWFVCGTTDEVRGVIIKWLEPFVKEQRQIQFVNDGSWFEYTVFMDFLTNHRMNQIPPAISDVPFDLNLALGLTMNIPENPFNITPAVKGSSTDRLDVLKELDFPEEKIPDPTIEMVYRVIIMKHIHNMLHNR